MTLGNDLRPLMDDSERLRHGRDLIGPSRNAIVGWGVGMLVVLGLTWFVAVVVVPVWRVRNAVDNIAGQYRGVRTLGGTMNFSDEEGLFHWHLGQLGGAEKAGAMLGSYINMPDFVAPHRPLAIELLARSGPTAIPRLVAFLHSPNVVERRATARSLKYIALRETHACVPFYYDWIPRQPADIGPRESAAAAPALVEALDDPDQSVRAFAAQALGRIGPTAFVAIPALIRVAEGSAVILVLSSSETSYPGYWLLQDRNIAVAVLTHIDPTDPSVLKTLEKALKDENCLIRRAAVNAVDRLKGKAGHLVPLLKEIALKQHSYLAAGACWRATGKSDVVMALVFRATAPHPYRNTEFMLSSMARELKIKENDLIGEICKVLKEGNPKDRALAARALGELGTRSAVATTALQAVLSSDEILVKSWSSQEVNSQTVRQAAIEALEKIKAAKSAEQ